MNTFKAKITVHVVIDEVLSVLNPEQDDEAIEHTGTIIWNYYRNGRSQEFHMHFL